MFAGAAREAVFSRDDVARRVRQEFVPVALKAALVNNPPAGPEGRFLREISRSKPAPQGICVANSAGKVLAWALSFDDDASVPSFVDHVLERYRAFPGAARPVVAERYMKFPSRPLADMADTREALPEVTTHEADGYCPATPPKARGTVVAKVWGRRVLEGGVLAGDCHRQENYIEDVFDIPPDMQGELARAVAAAGDGVLHRVLLPDRFARQLVTYTYLGQLDVRPVSSPVPDHRSKIDTLELWAAPMDSSPAGKVRLRIGGRSNVSSSSPGRRGDGASYLHEVTLEWQGTLSMDGERISGLMLYAEGREKLKWGNPALRFAREDDVAHLPAGKPLDIDTKVRYGIVGKPIADAEAWQKDEPPPRQPGLGGPPPEFRPKMQRLQRGMRRLARSGRNPQAVQAAAQRFTRLMQAGRFADAERALDRALALLEGGDQGDDRAPDAGGLSREFQERLRRVQHEIERLVREGKTDEAKRVLDEALKKAKGVR